MTWNIKTAGLWTESIAERLSSARALSNGALDALQIGLCEGCPVTPWPYGNATSINPLLVTLGASPGGSPNPNDPNAGENPLELPTAGVRHPHTTYEDAKGFWPKIRCLARTVLEVGTTTAEDAYALFGNMNLDTARSGKASDVQFDPVSEPGCCGPSEIGSGPDSWCALAFGPAERPTICWRRPLMALTTGDHMLSTA